jgi:CheY-like chemotaxis protein
LRALIDAEAAAFLAGQTERVTVEGPPILLNPQAYSTMALVVHELVTNSAKYGSLSDSGRVDIRWKLDDNKDLMIDWRESEGPTVKEPTRRGFGSTIIDRSIPYDLGGKAEVEYQPSGVQARFRIPAKHVTEPEDQSMPVIKYAKLETVPSAVRPEQILAGKNLLLVEDSLIIALDAEDILKRIGATSVTTAGTVEGALEAIDTVQPDMAMLDINLGDQTSFAIADRLHELGIPFLFATGYGEQAQLPEHHEARTVLQKPYTVENVARALPELVREVA